MFTRNTLLEAYLYSSQPFCGGTIISKRCIMTAAHCVKDFSESTSLINVVLGEHNWLLASETSNTQRKNVKKIIMHNDYDDFTGECIHFYSTRGGHKMSFVYDHRHNILLL